MKNFKVKKFRSRRTCARGSFRTKRLGKGRRLIICCPKGRYSTRSKRCKVGTVRYELLTPKRKQS